jgi:hypothetical protein
MLIVTFHGGTDGMDDADGTDDDRKEDPTHGHRKIAAYSDGGEPIHTNVLANIHASIGAVELRGLTFAPDGALLVLNASKERSEILAYTGSTLPYAPAGVLASYPHVNSLWHPFDLTFSSDGLRCYVSNQDTNVVARFEVGEHGSLTPAPYAPALPVGGTFLDGTFVASSDGHLPGVLKKTTPVHQDHGGLDVRVKDGKVAHSVRGVLWTNDALYVADEPGNAIKVYDARGDFLGQVTIDTPVHLLAHEGILYVTAAGGVFWTQLDATSPSHLILPLQAGIGMEHASGIAFGSGRSFYVADRINSKISWYEDFSPDAPPGAPTKIFDVDNNPEFILHADG